MPGIAIHSHECTRSAPTESQPSPELLDSVSLFSVMIASQNKISLRGKKKKKEKIKRSLPFCRP